MLLLICLGLLHIAGMEHDAPRITLDPLPARLLGGTEVSVLLEDASSGIKSVTVSLESEGRRLEILHDEYREKLHSRRIRFKLPLPAATGEVRDFKGTLRVTATDHSTARWWKGNSSTLDQEIILDLTPPAASILAQSRSIRRGGSGAVAFSVSEALTSACLSFAGESFPVFQLKSNRYVCIFTYPYYAGEAEAPPRLVLTDLAGNTASLELELQLTPVVFRQDTIKLGSAFLREKAEEFSRSIPDLTDPLELFLRMNGEIRAANYAELKRLCALTAGQALWRDGFMRLPRSVKRGFFADQRLYLHAGKIIDRRTHLGVDLASFSKDKIPVASSGSVLSAGYLGIHGNMVLVDHGLGLHSLYSHLSRIDVKAGQKVQRGQSLGLTGTSGMAGGDHLHLEFLVQGISVDPEEWLDRDFSNKIAAILAAAG